MKIIFVKVNINLEFVWYLNMNLKEILRCGQQVLRFKLAQIVSRAGSYKQGKNLKLQKMRECFD